MKLSEIYSNLLESARTKNDATIVLQRGGIEDIESIVNQLDSMDSSDNSANLASMAYFYVMNQDLNTIKDVFDMYTELVNKNRIKPKEKISLGKKTGVTMLGKSYLSNEFETFAIEVKRKNDSYSDDEEEDTKGKDFTAESDLIWPINPADKSAGIDIYDGHDVGKCIKYTTSGSLTGRGYQFCIGQPGNTMWKSYRDSDVSTFYYIVDKNHFVVDDDGIPSDDDPLHIVVFDAQDDGRIKLTDANNHTGSIAEPFGKDADKYVEYLRSKGVPVDKMMVNKPKTDIERDEDERLGGTNKDLDWFKDLSFGDKSKYIGRGHTLTDDQFDYLMGSNE